MAAQLEAGGQFRYQKVEIFFKYQSLGIGSYGAVYRAKCDQLPCAAKILHPTLFGTGDPGAWKIQQRFEQECHFLCGIRHPHIVQYLGTCRDRESGLPVLLMELMDDSLTHFLEECHERLSYHLEVNLCHDVALALAYLHSNGIIHRDLSSNNVLLIAGNRAKVSDFGMSRLVDANPRMTPLTLCPGTKVYTSPEAMREPPVYTDKLDCFAHGVMAIQIMTRMFPDPGPPTQLVNDPRSPTGTILIPVLEPQRRKSHIDHIDPNHPLLPVAVQCLSYNEEERSPAQQLCDKLAILKEAPQYAQSMQQVKERVTNLQENERVRQELERATQQLGQELNRAARNNEQLRKEVREKCDQIEESQQLRRELEQENEQLRLEVELATQENQYHDTQIAELQRQVRACELAMQELKKQLREKDAAKAASQQENLKLTQEFAVSIREREIQEQLKLKQQQKGSEDRKRAAKTIKLNWRQCTKAPCGIFRGSATVDGSMAYFRSGGTGTIHAYDTDNDAWSQLLECPRENFTLAVVEGLLTAVGGKQSDKPTNTLLSLTGKGSRRKWSKHFPPMPTDRYDTAVVCSGRMLVVAGGRMDYRTKLSTVEVMDTENLQWLTARSLPHPLTEASATICGEDLYLLRGLDQSGRPTKSVFTCSLSSLLQHLEPHSLESSLKRSLPQTRVWHTVADVPMFRSTCTTFCGHLLAVGGFPLDCNPTTAVHKYNRVENSWAVICHMKIARWGSLVAVLPGDRLMVVGGRMVGNNETTVVEIGSLV